MIVKFKRIDLNVLFFFLLLLLLKLVLQNITSLPSGFLFLAAFVKTMVGFHLKHPENLFFELSIRFIAVFPRLSGLPGGHRFIRSGGRNNILLTGRAFFFLNWFI